MPNQLSPSADRVRRALAEKGFSFEVLELPGSTRTAQEAATAVGCAVEQIAKSLVFKGKETGTPLLVIASGANRVNVKRMRALAGEPVEMARPELVRERTGYAIGGVPPVGHVHPMPTWIDADLLEHPVIWAAAGTPHAMFALNPADLEKMTGGAVAAIK